MASKEKKRAEETGLVPSRSERGLTPFEEMERWFDEFSPRGWMRPFRAGWPGWAETESPLAFGGRLPKVDVIDRDTELVVRAELPGVSKDNLDVSLTDDTVTIRARTETEKKEEHGEYYRREMSRGEFQRSLTLPRGVDSEKAKASFKDGVLELVLPKLETAKRKSIKVE